MTFPGLALPPDPLDEANAPDLTASLRTPRPEYPQAPATPQAVQEFQLRQQADAVASLNPGQAQALRAQADQLAAQAKGGFDFGQAGGQSAAASVGLPPAQPQALPPPVAPPPAPTLADRWTQPPPPAPPPPPDETALPLTAHPGGTSPEAAAERAAELAQGTDRTALPLPAHEGAQASIARSLALRRGSSAASVLPPMNAEEGVRALQHVAFWQTAPSLARKALGGNWADVTDAMVFDAMRRGGVDLSEIANLAGASSATGAANEQAGELLGTTLAGYPGGGAGAVERAFLGAGGKTGLAAAAGASSAPFTIKELLANPTLRDRARQLFLDASKQALPGAAGTAAKAAVGAGAYQAGRGLLDEQDPTSPAFWKSVGSGAALGAVLGLVGSQAADVDAFYAGRKQFADLPWQVQQKLTEHARLNSPNPEAGPWQPHTFFRERAPIAGELGSGTTASPPAAEVPIQEPAAAGVAEQRIPLATNFPHPGQRYPAGPGGAGAPAAFETGHTALPEETANTNLILPELRQAGPKALADYTAEATKAAQDEHGLDLLGTAMGHQVRALPSLGVFGGGVTPGVMNDLGAMSPEEASAFAAAHGIAHHQEAEVWVQRLKPDEDGPNAGPGYLVRTTEKPWSPAALKDLSDRMGPSFGATLAPDGTLLIRDFSGAPPEEFHDQLATALTEVTHDHALGPFDARVGRFSGQYIPRGDFLSTLADRPDLLRHAQKLASGRVAQVIRRWSETLGVPADEVERRLAASEASLGTPGLAGGVAGTEAENAPRPEGPRAGIGEGKQYYGAAKIIEPGTATYEKMPLTEREASRKAGYGLSYPPAGDVPQVKTHIEEAPRGMAEPHTFAITFPSGRQVRLAAHVDPRSTSRLVIDYLERIGAKAEMQFDESKGGGIFRSTMRSPSRLDGREFRFLASLIRERFPAVQFVDWERGGLSRRFGKENAVLLREKTPEFKKITDALRGRKDTASWGAIAQRLADLVNYQLRPKTAGAKDAESFLPQLLAVQDLLAEYREKGESPEHIAALEDEERVLSHIVLQRPKAWPAGPVKPLEEGLYSEMRKRAAEYEDTVEPPGEVREPAPEFGGRPLMPVPPKEGERASVMAIAHDYSPEHQMMRLKFPSGATYIYHDVTPEDYQQFLDAESKGKHFNAVLRGKHPFRLEHEPPSAARLKEPKPVAGVGQEELDDLTDAAITHAVKGHGIPAPSQDLSDSQQEAIIQRMTDAGMDPDEAWQDLGDAMARGRAGREQRAIEAVEKARRDAKTALDQLTLHGTYPHTQAGPSGTKVVASRYNAKAVLDLAKHEPAKLIGEHLPDAARAGQLFQVFTDPRFETLRRVFMEKLAERNYVIRHIMPVSSRMPGVVSFGETDLEPLTLELMAAHPTWSVMDMHNHPSHVVNPSREDIGLHKHTHAQLDALGMGARYLGHVVIDDEQFAFLPPERNEVELHDLPAPYKAIHQKLLSEHAADPLFTPKPKGMMSGEEAVSFKVAQALKLYQREGQALLLGVNNHFNVVHAVTLNPAWVRGASVGAIRSHLRMLARSAGAVHWVGGTEDKVLFDTYQEMAKRGILLSAFHMKDGKTVSVFTDPAINSQHFAFVGESSIPEAKMGKRLGELPPQEAPIPAKVASFVKAYRSGLVTEEKVPYEKPQKPSEEDIKADLARRVALVKKRKVVAGLKEMAERQMAETTRQKKSQAMSAMAASGVPGAVAAGPEGGNVTSAGRTRAPQSRFERGIHLWMAGLLSDIGLHVRYAIGAAASGGLGAEALAVSPLRAFWDRAVFGPLTRGAGRLSPEAGWRPPALPSPLSAVRPVIRAFDQILRGPFSATAAGPVGFGPTAEGQRVAANRAAFQKVVGRPGRGKRIEALNEFMDRVTTDLQRSTTTGFHGWESTNEPKDLIGLAVRSVFTMVHASYAANYWTAYNLGIERLGATQAAKRGLKWGTPSFEKFVREFVKDPTVDVRSSSGQLVKSRWAASMIAANVAAEIAFLGENPITTGLGKGIEAIRGPYPKTAGFVQSQAPFRRVPANALLRAVQYTPLGIGAGVAEAVRARRIQNAVTKVKDMLADEGMSAEHVKALGDGLQASLEKSANQGARGLLGTLAMAVALYFYEQYTKGHVTGVIKSSNRIAEAQGLRSLRFKVGDTWYPGQMLGPLLLPLVLGAGLGEGWDAGQQAQVQRVKTGFAPEKHPWFTNTKYAAADMLAVGRSHLSRLPFASGYLPEAGKLTMRQDEYAEVEKPIQDALGTFVPSILTNITRSLDPYERESYDKPLAAKLPGRESLPKHYDVLGHAAVEQETGLKGYLFQGIKARDNPVVDEVVRLHGMLPGPVETVATPAEGETPQNAARKRTLERPEVNQVKGEFGPLAEKAMQAVMHDPQYKKVDDDTKVLWLYLAGQAIYDAAADDPAVARKLSPVSVAHQERQRAEADALRQNQKPVMDRIDAAIRQGRMKDALHLADSLVADRNAVPGIDYPEGLVEHIQAQAEHHLEREAGLVQPVAALEEAPVTEAKYGILQSLRKRRAKAPQPQPSP